MFLLLLLKGTQLLSYHSRIMLLFTALKLKFNLLTQMSMYVFFNFMEAKAFVSWCDYNTQGREKTSSARNGIFQRSINRKLLTLLFYTTKRNHDLSFWNMAKQTVVLELVIRDGKLFCLSKALETENLQCFQKQWSVLHNIGQKQTDMYKQLFGK